MIEKLDWNKIFSSQIGKTVEVAGPEVMGILAEKINELIDEINRNFYADN